MTEQVFVACYA